MQGEKNGERCCGADRPTISVCTIPTGDIISCWSMKKESIILSVPEMDYINSEIGQNKDLWSHPQLE